MPLLKANANGSGSGSGKYDENGKDLPWKQASRQAGRQAGTLCPANPIRKELRIQRDCQLK